MRAYDVVKLGEAFRFQEEIANKKACLRINSGVKDKPYKRVTYLTAAPKPDAPKPFPL